MFHLTLKSFYGLWKLVRGEVSRQPVLFNFGHEPAQGKIQEAPHDVEQIDLRVPISYLFQDAVRQHQHKNFLSAKDPWVCGVPSFADLRLTSACVHIRWPVPVPVPVLLDTAWFKVTLSSIASMACKHEQHCSEKIRSVYDIWHFFSNLLWRYPSITLPCQVKECEIGPTYVPCGMW